MRILSICPCSRGFGFAVLEDGATLVNWGVKSATGDKNRDCLRQVEAMLELYQPDLLVLEDPFVKGSRRSERIKELLASMASLAKTRKLRTHSLRMTNVFEGWLGTPNASKHELAGIIAGRFPEELGDRLPPKRKPWQSEDARLDMFKAVALALHAAENRKVE